MFSPITEKLDRSGVRNHERQSHKRTAREDEISEQARMHLQEQPISRKKLKNENPIIIMDRIDGFRVTAAARNKFMTELLDDDLVKLIEEKNAPAGKINLARGQLNQVEQVRKYKSSLLGSQLYDLYEMLISLKKIYRDEGRLIIDFARELIDELEDLDVVAMEIDEIEEKYIELAKAFAEELPFAMRNDSINEMAMALQQKANNMNVEENQENDGEREEIALTITGHLGAILLAVQYDLKSLTRSISKGTLDQKLDGVYAIVDDIISQSADELQKYSDLQEATALQSPSESTFRQMSVEIAKLAVMSSGKLNFGILYAVVENLMPESFKDLIATKNLMYAVEQLVFNPELRNIIAFAKPPASRDLPSDQGIRACLGLNQHIELTVHHAQVALISTYLGHWRQANAGTCFATGPMIYHVYHSPDVVFNDLVEIMHEGNLKRIFFQELRDYPFQMTTSCDYLNVQIAANKRGEILSTEKYESKPKSTRTWKGPYKNAFLYDAPGIRSVCTSLNLNDVENCVMEALQKLAMPFTPCQLIEQLAEIALTRQEGRYHPRGQEKLTKEELILRGEYFFCSQTNHPFQRGYEQCLTLMSNGFGSQYYYPNLIFNVLEKYLEGADKGCDRMFQTRFKKLIKELCLPMVSRMRYKYNHHIKLHAPLFNDGNHGVNDERWYGYELYDCGLPDDFTYSQNLYRDQKHETGSHILERFHHYAPPEKWVPVNTQEKFVAFLQDVIKETADFCMKKDKDHQELWEQVSEKLCNAVAKDSLIENLITKLFRGERLRKEYRKNPITMQTKPWSFKWGGCFDSLLETLYGVDAPSGLHEYKGNQREVLAKNIDWIRKQPDEIKKGFDDPISQLIIASPCHVFLLTPNEESFRKAWESELPAAEYIKTFVEGPGLEIANTRIKIRMRNALIDYVADNMWTSRDLETHDYERQQLTEFSKNEFDIRLSQIDNLHSMSPEKLTSVVHQVIVQSRAADPKIGERNGPWDQRCFRMLTKKMQNININAIDWRNQLIEFARDRSDHIYLSEESSRLFRKKMEAVPEKISITEFRTAVLKNAYDVHCEELCGIDKEWKNKLLEFFDSKIFDLLSPAEKKKLIASGIITHDPNWKSEMHDRRVIWLINPGSGKLEFCNFIPDTGAVTFREQEGWFPQNKGPYQNWEFPNNVLKWSDRTLFKRKKLLNF